MPASAEPPPNEPAAEAPALQPTEASAADARELTRAGEAQIRGHLLGGDEAKFEVDQRGPIARIRGFVQHPWMTREEKFRKSMLAVVAPSQLEAESAGAPVDAVAIAKGVGKSAANVALGVAHLATDSAEKLTGMEVALPDPFAIDPAEARGAAVVELGLNAVTGGIGGRAVLGAARSVTTGAALEATSHAGGVIGRGVQLAGRLTTDAATHTARWFRHEFVAKVKRREPAAVAYAGLTGAEAAHAGVKLAEGDLAGAAASAAVIVGSKGPYLAFEARHDLAVAARVLRDQPLARTALRGAATVARQEVRSHVIDGKHNLVEAYAKGGLPQLVARVKKR